MEMEVSYSFHAFQNQVLMLLAENYKNKCNKSVKKCSEINIEPNKIKIRFGLGFGLLLYSTATSCEGQNFAQNVNWSFRFFMAESTEAVLFEANFVYMRDEWTVADQEGCQYSRLISSARTIFLLHSLIFSPTLWFVVQANDFGNGYFWNS